MRLASTFGQRLDGSFAAEIAAPGQDLRTAGARRLFTTDASFVQVVFSGTIALTPEIKESTTNGPAGPVKTYTLTGTGTYVFPFALPFRPEIYLTTFITKDGESEYQLATAPGMRAFTHEVQTDSVAIRFTQSFGTNISVTALTARVTVLNIPWDRT